MQALQKKGGTSLLTSRRTSHGEERRGEQLLFLGECIRSRGRICVLACLSSNDIPVVQSFFPPCPPPGFPSRKPHQPVQTMYLLIP
jgi:hypothetical protein